MDCPGEAQETGSVGRLPTAAIHPFEGRYEHNTGDNGVNDAANRFPPAGLTRVEPDDSQLGDAGSSRNDYDNRVPLHLTSLAPAARISHAWSA